MTPNKKCTVCGKEFPASPDYFNKKKTGKFGLVAKCKKCMINYSKQIYKKHREKRLEEKRIENIEKPEKMKEKRRKQYIKHREKRLKEAKEYNIKNKKKIKKRISKYTIERYHKDECFRIKMNLSRRMRNLFKKNNSRTVCFLGCSIDFLKKHLESKFKDGMSWENYGEWHIDHIVPCSFFDLTDLDQQKKCFNYTNLQPLWAIDNIKKSNIFPYISE